MEDLWNAILSMTEQVPKGNSRLEIKSSNFELSTLPSYKAMTHAPLEAVAARTLVPVQDPFVCKQKRQEHLEAHRMSLVIAVPSNAASSMTTKRGIFVRRTALTVYRDRFSEVLA